MEAERRIELLEKVINEHIRSDHVRQSDLTDMKDELRNGFVEIREGMQFMRDSAIRMSQTVQDILKIVRWTAVGIAGIIVGDKVGLIEMLTALV